MSELGIKTWEFLAGLWPLFLSSPEQGNEEMINCSLPQSSAFACVFPSSAMPPRAALKFVSLA